MDFELPEELRLLKKTVRTFVDRELRFRRINPVYARWHQGTPDEIVGRAYEDVVSPEFEAQAAPLLRTVLRTGKPIVSSLVRGMLAG